MLAVRSAWAAGRPAEVVARSGRGHFGLMADDHRAQHFGLFVNGRLMAYARCAPLPGIGSTMGAAAGSTAVAHVLDTLLAHPDLRPGDAAKKVMTDTISFSLRILDGWLRELPNPARRPLPCDTLA